MKLDFATLVIKESFIESEKNYTRRVHILATFYTALFWTSLGGLSVLIHKMKLYITLAQRSNVETLTLAFFCLFFLYMGCTSFPGFWGTLRLLYASSVRDRGKREERKIALLKKGETQVSVALNFVITKEGKPFEVPVQDDYGTLGILKFNGARLGYTDYLADGSNTLFSFVVAQIRKRRSKDDSSSNLLIVEWGKINNEETEKFLSHVEFARRLQPYIGAPLWPEISLTEADVEDLTSRLKSLCPTLRSEALLPDWEYEGQHKIPVIPEPLGIISLSRSEKRVDPVASMGAVFLILFFALILFVLMVFYPPWVPGI